MSSVRGVIAAATGLAVLGALATATNCALNAGSGVPPRSPGAGPSRPSIARELPLPRTGPTVRGPRNPTSGFAHPGILVGVGQLEFARVRINVGQQPWLEAFDALQSSRYASLSWRPKPRPVVDCGPYSVPNHGCEDEESDAVAAYTHALLWYLTGDRAHAAKAAEIIDAWARVIRQHTNRNAPLQAAWSAASLVRAAEILRHTYDGWMSERASAMFRTAYLPLVESGAPQAGGNWELILLDAATSIAVFLDDRALFNQALARMRARAATFVYLASDGPSPKAPPWAADIVKFWYGQRTFVPGLTQETCRDFGHTGWGLAAMAHIAETAWLQGINVYAELRQRLTSALEFHAGYELGDGPVPGWLCGGAVRRGFEPVPEVAYHHYSVRLGIPLPKTGRLVESMRPQLAAFFYGWETLTHAGRS